MKPMNLILGVTCVALAILSTRAEAQARTRQVAVAIVEELSQPAVRAEILRFADTQRPDVILLRRRDASAADLAAAIAAYRLSVQRSAGRPGAVGRVFVTEHSADAAGAKALRGRAEQILRQVRGARPSRVGNYGAGQWATVAVQVGG